MNKTEFVKAVAEKTGVAQKTVDEVIKAYADVVSETLAAGESIQFVGFGTYKVTERAARTGRNPQTGKEIKIAAAKVPSFKAGAALKAAVNPAPKKATKKKK